ncbi:chromosome segregation and condensation protein ScpA [Caldicellulosiruptor hydrothermalis 108]|uniref:Segregation and condensation protein A n=1 Tax=Caldicellulosiruptor hydrothermalis (strain DSM 18901 / VKM B-2411 / 108) TaxID=632292 RepID=E4QDI6_CALH1|nr:segregation/condensation protein A [Caldicellulosiruptor hydrothermalis]ADQ07604.1 chromosome segregation and condensation protein ScpA [Caldicellulosiruptor hydrothermalis 108]
MNFEVKLPNFEGPLDLLLYFIKKEKINIYDIPISEITSQYLAYLNHLDTINVDSVSEFMVMAATLLEIKSRMLLPKAQEDQDPRQELVERLREYQKYKQVAIYLKENFPYRECYRKTNQGYLLLKENKKELITQLDIRKLCRAYLAAVQKNEDFLKESVQKLQEITRRQPISILKVVKQVFEYIKQKGVLYFSNLIKGISKEEIIYRFLAILELCKLGHIFAHQDKMFDDIKILKR